MAVKRYIKKDGDCINCWAHTASCRNCTFGSQYFELRGTLLAEWVPVSFSVQRAKRKFKNVFFCV